MSVGAMRSDALRVAATFQCLVRRRRSAPVSAVVFSSVAIIPRK
jgi:hypothetical protein